MAVLQPKTMAALGAEEQTVWLPAVALQQGLSAGDYRRIQEIVDAGKIVWMQREGVLLRQPIGHGLEIRLVEVLAGRDGVIRVHQFCHR